MSYDSTFFNAVVAGDLKAVQDMLAAKKAFVTDRIDDSYGLTPLHVGLPSVPSSVHI